MVTIVFALSDQKSCIPSPKFRLMPLPADLTQRLRLLINRDRLVETAVELVEIPSKTGDAGVVLDRLGRMLTDEGFPVERPPVMFGLGRLGAWERDRS